MLLDNVWHGRLHTSGATFSAANYVYVHISFEVLSSVMKYAICSSIRGPLILIGMTPLCHGGILSIDLTVPIVAFCSQLFV